MNCSEIMRFGLQICKEENILRLRIADKNKNSVLRFGRIEKERTRQPTMAKTASGAMRPTCV